MSFLQRGTLESGNLVARARLIHGGKSVALSEVSVEDSQGRLLAHGTSRGFLQSAPSAPPPRERPGQPEYSTPDPYLRRPVLGSPMAQDVWDRISGLEALQRCMKDPDEAAPMRNLIGLRPVEASEGICTFVMPASPWLASPQPILYGGAIALLADAALSGAVMTVSASGGSFAPLDLKVSYLRPVAPDGSVISARATLVHRGRTMAVATAEVLNAEGKRIALASSSVMLLPGRPWRDVLGLADGDTGPPPA